MGDGFGERGSGGGEEGARREGGRAVFLRRRSGVVGADLCGEAVGAVGDAGL